MIPAPVKLHAVIVDEPDERFHLICFFVSPCVDKDRIDFLLGTSAEANLSGTRVKPGKNVFGFGIQL